MPLVSVVCCQVEVPVSRWSPIQRSPTECGVSTDRDREASMMRPWPIRDCRTIKKIICAGDIRQLIDYFL
jgi:hypothetical protein